MSFDCDRCGACCKNIRLSEFYCKEFDRGDGVCKYLTADNLCMIYSERPLFCNVDAYYEKFLSHKMSREKYYEMNRASCAELKNLTGDSNRAIFEAFNLGRSEILHRRLQSASLGA